MGRKFESTFCKKKNDCGVLGGSAGHLLEKPFYTSPYHKGNTKKEKGEGVRGREGGGKEEPKKGRERGKKKKGKKEKKTKND